MSEQTVAKGKEKGVEVENMDPVHIIRKGAIAASVWQRQSPSGFAYYDYSISRSWLEVIHRASGWIVERRELEKNLAQKILAA